MNRRECGFQSIFWVALNGTGDAKHHIARLVKVRGMRVAVASVGGPFALQTDPFPLFHNVYNSIETHNCVG